MPPAFARLVLSSLALLPLSTLAFDSQKWLEKRALLDRETERLQAAYSNCVSHLDQPAENIEIPVESHANGRVKTLVRAARAQFFLDTGFIWGEDVVVRQFRADGSVEAEVFARHCVVDRETRACWAEGPARATYGRTRVSGEGIYFSFREEYVKISSKVDIQSEDMKVEGVRL